MSSITTTPTPGIMSHRHLAARLFVAIAAASFLAACDAHSPSEPAPLASITVTPNANLAINGTHQFTAVGYDANNNVVTITPTWNVVAGGGAVNSTGLFTAGSVVGVYTNTVRATSGSISGTATATVTAGPLTTITLTPNPQTLGVGATQQFVAVGTDAGGNVVPITPVWTIAAGGGAVNSTGMFTAGTTTGTFANTVRATSGTVSATATVTVSSGPLASITLTPSPATVGLNGTQQFTAVGRDASNNLVAFTPTWTVVNGGGSISGAGVFTAGAAAGTYASTVRVASGSISAVATVIVTPGALSTITVTPNPTSLAVLGTQQFTAVGRDASNNIIAITPTWSVVAGGGAVNGTGMFTAGAAPGTYTNTVRATSGAISGNATVTVTPGALATITLTPNPANLATGAGQQFTAVGRDANNNIVTITPVWTVAAGGGVVNGTGMFTAGGTVGTYLNTVRATSGSIVGVATVTVGVGPVATITVTPNPHTMDAGTSRQFIATARDASNNIVPITPTWSVVAGGGVVNGTGLFTAGMGTGVFANTVRATSGAISGNATVTVQAVVVPPLVPLGAAGSHGILAGSAVTCVDLGSIIADVSVSPGTSLSGFPPCTISGAIHLNDAFAAAAKADLVTAYNQLDAMPCGAILTDDLGGKILAPGVHCSLSSQGLTGQMFLDGNGDPNAVFVIKAASTLTTAGALVTLQNGAQAKNVYWLVGSSATLGVGSAMQGNIIALTSITMVDNATLIGRALARNGAVSLGTGNVIILP